jgi:hypothetical protein
MTDETMGPTLWQKIRLGILIFRVLTYVRVRDALSRG